MTVWLRASRLTNESVRRMEVINVEQIKRVKRKPKKT